MKLEINIKTIDEALVKHRAESSVVIDLLKRTGISGIRAVQLYQQYGPDYCTRKYFHTEYVRPRDKRRFLQADIRENYAESDGFYEWFKRRKTEILLNDNIPIELQQIVGRIL